MNTRLPVASLATALVASSLAAAQTLVVDQSQHIAVETGLVPGLVAGEIFSSFDSAVVDDSGRALFRGRIFGGSATSTTDRAYFLGDSAQTLSMILRSGDPEPSGTIPGAVIGTTSFSGLTSSPRISGNGTIFFATSINDGGVSIDSSNDSALYVGTPGNFQLLAREGDPAPDTAGAVYASSFSSLSHQQSGLNDLGSALFKSTLAGTGVDTTNDVAWFKGSPGNVSIVAREGDPVGAGQIIDRVSPSFISQINVADLVLFDVSYVVGSGPGPVASSNDRALLVSVPGGGLIELVREGDPSPYPGASYTEPNQFNWSISTSGNAFNAQGEALINAQLDGGFGDSAIIRVSLLGNVPVVRVGETVPGVSGATFAGFNNSSLNLAQNGRVTFQGFFEGPGINEFNDTALFSGFPGALELVAREGDVAPGTGGLLWRGFSGISSYTNNFGQVVFTQSVTADPLLGPTTGAQWYYDPVDGLRQTWIGDGSTVDLGTGSPVAPTSAGGVQFGNGASRPLSFADDGTAILRFNYTTGLSSVTAIRPERLAGAPADVSVASGGTHTLQLSGGSSFAGNLFFLLGSASGTAPGLPLDGFTLPLNFDAFLAYTIDSANTPPFGNTFGVLDDLGRAASTVTVPAGAPGLAGVSLDFAYVSIDAAGIPFVTGVSNASHLDLIP